MNVLEKRAIISTLLLIDFIIVSFTGLVLYIYHEISHYFPLIKEIHIYSGLIMILLVAIHFQLNYQMYKNEIKQILK